MVKRLLAMATLLVLLAGCRNSPNYQTGPGWVRSIDEGGFSAVFESEQGVIILGTFPRSGLLSGLVCTLTFDSILIRLDSQKLMASSIYPRIYRSADETRRP